MVWTLDGPNSRCWRELREDGSLHLTFWVYVAMLPPIVGSRACILGQRLAVSCTCTFSWGQKAATLGRIPTGFGAL
ncbi:hypothetical protein SISSUDRAFT_922402 [Sistotremastrum suecicum HHB10207 ss-3]|uniref:Uncharacterized protein n=1 Tax=Sistotremastrum suecicum HHB10207 ss-3 TaxID=1314776 RepID=A0A166BXE2_9AGAM|nr:hypothetical protein SISSUDRAFT_922402 [Sistotremastrum suecicum HHB10207 ss-3]